MDLAGILKLENEKLHELTENTLSCLLSQGNSTSSKW